MSVEIDYTASGYYLVDDTTFVKWLVRPGSYVQNGQRVAQSTRNGTTINQVCDEDGLVIGLWPYSDGPELHDPPEDSLFEVRIWPSTQFEIDRSAVSVLTEHGQDCSILTVGMGSDELSNRGPISEEFFQARGYYFDFNEPIAGVCVGDYEQFFLMPHAGVLNDVHVQRSVDGSFESLQVTVLFGYKPIGFETTPDQEAYEVLRSHLPKAAAIKDQATKSGFTPLSDADFD